MSIIDSTVTFGSGFLDCSFLSCINTFFKVSSLDMITPCEPVLSLYWPSKDDVKPSFNVVLY